MKRFTAVFCAALAMCSAASLEAATFFTDKFNYANGDLTLFDGSGDNVSAGAWTIHSPTGPTFNPPSIEVANGQAVLLTPGSEDANRAISDPVNDAQGAGETWYYAALVTVNDQRATPATTGIINEYFMHFKDTASNFRSRLYVKDPSTGVGGAGFRFSMGASSGAANAVDWGTDLAFGVQYLVVGSYAFDTGAASLWVNPASSASTSITATASPGPGTFTSALALRQAFVNGAGPNTQILVNAVAMGDTFDSVVASVTIPEPATLSLAALGMLSLVGLGRRR